MTIATVFAEAQKLTKDEQFELVAMLWDALDDEDLIAEIHPSWKDEIKRRIDAYESGDIKLVPHAVVMASIRKKLTR